MVMRFAHALITISRQQWSRQSTHEPGRAAHVAHEAGRFTGCRPPYRSSAATGRRISCAVARPTSIRTPTSGRAGRSSGRSSRLCEASAGRLSFRLERSNFTNSSNEWSSFQASISRPLSGEKWWIVIEIASQVTRQQPSLHVRDQANRNFLAQEPMGDLLSLSLLVRCQHRLSAIVTEPHGAAWPFGEVAWLELSAGKPT